MRIYLLSLFLLPVLVSCATKVPAKALELGPESLAKRQLQTRSYETDDEKKVLSACASLLQDTGFNIEEVAMPLGVVVGSKDRSAKTAGQVVGKIALAALFGAMVAIDESQTMRASIVTRPFGEDAKRIAVRVTFQRIVVNEQGQISKRQPIEDEKVYQEFFDKLSKSLFLEAQSI